MLRIQNEVQDVLMLFGAIDLSDGGGHWTYTSLLSPGPCASRHKNTSTILLLIRPNAPNVVYILPRIYYPLV